jgi:hypothetical protein
MRKVRLLAVLIFAFGILGISAHVQGNSTKDTAAPSASAAVLERWNEIGRKLIAMSEDFPENKYDFKPTPTVRTFAEALIHAAATNYFFTNVALGQKPPADEDPKRDQFKNKAAIVAFVKKSFADGAGAIKAKGDAGISSLIVSPFTNERTRMSDFAYDIVEHSGEVYGQLTVYYRVSGLIPPESRPKK